MMRYCSTTGFRLAVLNAIYGQIETRLSKGKSIDY
jgi:hypothetical protein